MLHYKLKNIITILNSSITQQYTDIYNNNQTISTKCQYQAANEKPKYPRGVKWQTNIL